MSVDIEALVVAALKADTALDGLVDGRVSTELPGDLDEHLPHVQLWSIPGGTYVRPEPLHLERARLQVSVWATTKGSAWDTATAVVAAAATMLGTYDLGVVTGVEVEQTPYWAPDPDTDTPRYLSTIGVFAHPIAA